MILSVELRLGRPLRRLAPFRALPRPPQPAAGEAGLALFDAVPFPSRANAGPSFSALPAAVDLTTLVLDRVGPLTEQRCPNCGWTDVRRSSARNLNDYLLSVFGLVPYRCRTCSDRFHRTRPAALRQVRLEPALSFDHLLSPDKYSHSELGKGLSPARSLASPFPRRPCPEPRILTSPL